VRFDKIEIIALSTDILGARLGEQLPISVMLIDY
jgi:hypothetical protein